MTSVRLNILRSSENGDLTIECVSDDLRHLKVETEPSGDDHFGLHVSIFIESDPISGERHGNHAPKIVEGRNAVDGLDGDVVRVDRNAKPRDGGFCGLGGNQVVSGNGGILGHIDQSSQQVGQSKANPSSQTAVYQSYDGRSQVCKYQTYPAIKDDDEDAA